MPAKNLSSTDAQSVHLFSQAGRLAFADRAKYIADPDFVNVPVEGWLDSLYLASRADLVDVYGNDTGIVQPGIPPGTCTVIDNQVADERIKVTGTSHLSIVDRYGNALSATTTIESPLGNGVMVGGFLLNNELTDFSFSHTDEKGHLVANRVEVGKRPRSSMSPTIVFDETDEVAILTGSTGGALIIGDVAQSIWNILRFGKDPQEAAQVPHYQHDNGEKTKLEPYVPGITEHWNVTAVAEMLARRGHGIDVRDFQSGLAIISSSVQGGKRVLVGGVDGRRDGSVGGSNLVPASTMSTGLSLEAAALRDHVGL